MPYTQRRCDPSLSVERPVATIRFVFADFVAGTANQDITADQVRLPEEDFVTKLRSAVYTERGHAAELRC